ncbi:MAG TPA: hypothetical protein PKI46_01345 [Bacteroidales bacterium]|nr:hypothetical protein [Bacteroidales bacterium]
MNKTPAWIKDTILISILVYIIFSFIYGTLDCNEWTICQRGIMMFIIIVLTTMFEVNRLEKS